MTTNPLPSEPPYPDDVRARDKWIVERRPDRQGGVDPLRPYGVFSELEREADGHLAWCATILLTGSECPWRCLMCDLWKATIPGKTPAGAIPAQIDHALEILERPATDRPTIIKLYNGGSFFDPRAVPPADYERIAEQVCGFNRIVVECHPSLVGPQRLTFRERLTDSASRISKRGFMPPRLEIAMGLETAHPEVLDKLNKRMTLEDFSRAAQFLASNEIDLRVFVLVKPPFLDERSAADWALRSVTFAFDQGATAVALIPTRTGNGAMDALQRQGNFTPPRLSLLESCLAKAIGLGRGRVFADLWDLGQFSRCRQCFPARLERLRRMNLEQQSLPGIACDSCGGTLSES